MSTLRFGELVANGANQGCHGPSKPWELTMKLSHVWLGHLPRHSFLSSGDEFDKLNRTESVGLKSQRLRYCWIAMSRLDQIRMSTFPLLKFEAEGAGRVCSKMGKAWENPKKAILLGQLYVQLL